jgi:hypothetical protein
MTVVGRDNGVHVNALMNQPLTSRRIALLKPARTAGESCEHALRLFDSILWALRGTTRKPWSVCAPAQAEVIAIHHEESAERVAYWREQGKVIVALSTSGGECELADRSIVYPFRASEVVALLQRLDDELDERTPARGERPMAVGDWDVAEALRALHAEGNTDVWMALGTDDAPFLWVRGDAAIYRGSAGIRRALRQGTLPLRGARLRQADMPRDLPDYSGEELAWFAGYHAGSTLAPWLDERTCYRLRRWPDFGLLRARDGVTATAQLRVAAALDAMPSEPAALARRARAPREPTVRTLNALSLCRLIETVGSQARTNRTVYADAGPLAGFRQFFRRLRKHLQGRSDA